MIYLDETQVVNMINDVTGKGEVIMVRCIRKTKGNSMNGTIKGFLHTLVCAKKPEYESKVPNGAVERKVHDKSNHVLTVWALNRLQDGKLGCWRRVNVAQVEEIVYNGEKYKVTRG